MQTNYNTVHLRGMAVPAMSVISIGGTPMPHFLCKVDSIGTNCQVERVPFRTGKRGRPLHRPHRKRLSLCILAIASLFPVLLASPEEMVLIHHSFAGTPESALSASPAVSSNGSTGWAYAHPALRSNGLFTGGEGGGRNAYLPFSPEEGHIYTATLKLEISNPLADHSDDSKDWAAIGLSDKLGRVGPLPLAAACSLLVRRDGTGEINLRSKAGNPNNDYHRANVVQGETQATLSLILNTTGSDWEVTFQFNGEDVGSRIFKTKPAIQFLGIGQLATAEGRFIELTLTRTDP